MNLSAVQEHARKHIAGYKVPAQFRAEFALPFTGFYARYTPHVEMAQLEECLSSVNVKLDAAALARIDEIHQLHMNPCP